MRGRGGELDVTSGTTTTAVRMNFAIEALAPELERAYVYGDATSPVGFVGTLDFAHGIIMGAAFTVSAGLTPNAIHTRKCQLSLMIPRSPSGKASVL
jgi:hypothetical protein